MSDFTPDPRFDLVLERDIPVPPDRVYAAWTEPELMVQWFTPAPFKTVSAELDVRPTGGNVIVMESPDGQQFPNTGCYLQVIPGELIVFTSALTDGFRPVVPQNGAEDMAFTGRIELTANADGGTHYRAIAIHGTEEAATRHAEMGFTDGWGAALDQLVALLS